MFSPPAISLLWGTSINSSARFCTSGCESRREAWYTRQGDATQGPNTSLPTPLFPAVPGSKYFGFESKNKEKGFLETCFPKAAACRVVVTSTAGHAEDEPGQPCLGKKIKKKVTFPLQRCPEGFCSNISGAEMKLNIQFKSQQSPSVTQGPFAFTSGCQGEEYILF